MFRKNLFLLLAVCSLYTASSQTLFTYGGTAVSSKEFLKAFEKNNAAPATTREKALREYLDLFIKSKLKVREAYERRYDTLHHLRDEALNLRAQSMEKYMTDPQMMPRLQNEAFQRSLKDIHVAHIYLAFKAEGGVYDSSQAVRKREEVLQELKKGSDFGVVAQKFSDDPGAASNKGDIGYITVFSLPYPFENAVYNLQTGKYSDVIRSRNGFHIFKKIGERKAVGAVKAQQILLAFPPDADAAVKQTIAKRADSLYKALLAGASFSQLAATFSNDYISAASGGNMPDIRVGEFEPAFENAVFGLKKDGELAKPVLTSHGWHILKRVSAKPVVTNPADKNNIDVLQQRIMADNRWRSGGDFIYSQVREKGNAKRAVYNEAAFLAYGDSVLNMQMLRPEGKSLDTSSTIFQVGIQKYSLGDWIAYARIHRFKQDGTGAKPHGDVRDDWEKQKMMDYYRDHLEDFNDEFRNLMTEFRDGNLFFEIMQREVWNKAQTDTAALRELYNRNPKAYTWKQSADAVMFFFIDPSIVTTIYEAVKKNPSTWRRVTEGYPDKVIADSNRYEWSQIPNLNKAIPRAGMITTPVENKVDNTTSFAWIVNVYPSPMPRSFEESRGLLVNDYQVELEKKWDLQLRSKYPVVVDDKVLSLLLKP